MATTTRVLTASVNGTVYTTNVNGALEAIDTCHSGATAPTDEIANGKFWLDTTTTPAILKMYNNAVWEEIGGSTSSPTFGGLTVSNNAAGIADAIELQNSSGESSYVKANRGLTLSADHDNNSTAAQSNITFETDGSEVMRIDSSGNVGIGDVSPSEALSVTGNISATGTVTATTLTGDGSGITGVLKATDISITKTVLTTGTAATYTTPTDAFAIEVEVLGAGGGGGGVDGQGSGKAACGIAGGAGGYSQMTIMNPASSYTYTIGAGGAGGAAGANIGSTGGTTSFTDGVSVTLSGSGGVGGTGRSATGGGSPNGGVLGGVATGGDLNIQGQCSSAGVVVSGVRAALSMGGSTKYGAGAIASNSTAESPAGFGSGGGAGAVQNATTNYAGTAGADGVIVITEYRA